MGTPNAPECVGLILDGNRRWAKAKMLPQLAGHRRGLETYKTIALHAQEREVKHLVSFMFSTENWTRSEEEVSYLMNLFREMGRRELEELTTSGIRVRFVGQRERFAPDLAQLMGEIEAGSTNNSGMTAWLCLSYGGRAEIIAAARTLATAGKDITEQSLRAALWTADLPDPDLIIRTSGEQRLSNFLPWQSVYSELFFTNTLWPDFSPQEFDAILKQFAARERRRGK